LQPVYTLQSFLKRFLIGQDKQLTVNELTHLLQKFEHEINDTYSMSVDELIANTIYRSDSPFAIDTTEIISLEVFPRKINDIAYEFLLQTGKPQSLERIIKHVTKKTKVQQEQILRQLYLEKDIRFVQIEGNARWILTEWEICNDQLYQILLERNISDTNITHIYQLISTQIQRKDEPRRVWMPEQDTRFTVLDNGKVILVLNKHEEATNMELHNTTNREQHNTTNMEQHNIFEKAINHLEQAIELLKHRNDKMSNEVLQYFNANDLDAIHSLMEEKQTNLEFQQDLMNTLEKWKK